MPAYKSVSIMSFAVSDTLPGVFNLSLLHPSESPWESITYSTLQTERSSLHQVEEHAAAEVSPTLIILCHNIILCSFFGASACAVFSSAPKSTKRAA